jgi:hypothetical protein
MGRRRDRCGHKRVDGLVASRRPQGGRITSGILIPPRPPILDDSAEDAGRRRRS